MESKLNWKVVKDYEDIIYSHYEGIAKISINRPHKHNAFTPKTVMEMSEAMEHARQDQTVGVVIITGEGGKSPSRFKHVVDSDRGLRRLTPIELERLNMFPDNHTKLEGITDTKRAFFMGNALVVGVIEAIGAVFAERIK